MIRLIFSYLDCSLLFSPFSTEKNAQKHQLTGAFVRFTLTKLYNKETKRLLKSSLSASVYRRIKVRWLPLVFGEPCGLIILKAQVQHLTSTTLDSVITFIPP